MKPSWCVAGATLLLFLGACGDSGGPPDSQLSAPLAPPGAASQAPSAESVSLCLSMAGSASQVVGMQVDAHWDPSCMDPVVGEDGAGDCTADPATGKMVRTAVHGASLRAVLLSFSDVDPIPDGSLFCCNFTRRSSSCCALGLTNLIASDSHGERVGDAATVYQASLGGAPCVAVDGTGDPSGRNAVGAREGSGSEPAGSAIPSVPGAKPASPAT